MLLRSSYNMSMKITRSASFAFPKPSYLRTESKIAKKNYMYHFPKIWEIWKCEGRTRRCLIVEWQRWEYVFMHGLFVRTGNCWCFYQWILTSQTQWAPRTGSRQLCVILTPSNTLQIRAQIRWRFISALQGKCGKVMFSVMSICSLGVVPPAWLPAPLWGNIGDPLPRHVQTCSTWTSLTGTSSPWTCSTLFLMKHVQLASWAVGILLECFLVITRKYK